MRLFAAMVGDTESTTVLGITTDFDVAVNAIRKVAQEDHAQSARRGQKLPYIEKFIPRDDACERYSGIMFNIHLDDDGYGFEYYVRAFEEGKIMSFGVDVGRAAQIIYSATDELALITEKG